MGQRWGKLRKVVVEMGGLAIIAFFGSLYVILSGASGLLYLQP
jgi:hypothetical protein